VEPITCERPDWKITPKKAGRFAKRGNLAPSRKTLFLWLVLSISLAVLSPSASLQAQRPTGRFVSDLSFEYLRFDNKTFSRSARSVIRIFDTRMLGAGQTPQTQDEIELDIALLTELAERWW
jgi:hypothetical protein